MMHKWWNMGSIIKLLWLNCTFLNFKTLQHHFYCVKHVEYLSKYQKGHITSCFTRPVVGFQGQILNENFYLAEEFLLPANLYLLFIIACQQKTRNAKWLSSTLITVTKYPLICSWPITICPFRKVVTVPVLPCEVRVFSSMSFLPFWDRTWCWRCCERTAVEVTLCIRTLACEQKC